MQGICIRGMSVCCALGEDIGRAVDLMRDMQVPSTALQLDEFSEPVRMMYYRMPDHAELSDPARIEQLLMQVVLAAVARAEMNQAEIRQLPVFTGSSCFSIGVSESRYASTLETDPEHAVPMPLCGYQDISDIARRALGSSGDTYTYNTACTSSANALLSAIRMLRLGWYRHALVIGAELFNLTTLTGFSGLQLVDDAVRPFDAARRGIVLGEGISAVVLSTQSGDSNLEILGGASNCDTSSVTTANPDGVSVAAVIQQALKNTGTDPEQIRGIKAHGTATPSGDTAEAAGLRRVFTTVPPVSVLKPYLGHTLGACGVNELVLFASALQCGFLPATPGFETPDPELGVHPLKASQPAQRGRYLLNHFGFGGNNTVLVVEKTA